MLSYLNKETNYRFTENGALTYSSTGSDCLDLFDSVGAVHHAKDKERYLKFIERAALGQTVMHSDNVCPYELVETYLRNCEWDSTSCSLSKEEIMVLNTTWEAMPGFGTEENTLTVIDTSGSMYCNLKPAPASVALSLGLYFAEKSRGYFKNHC